MPWQQDAAFETGAQTSQQTYMARMLEGLREKQESAKFQAENMIDLDPTHIHPTAHGFGQMTPEGKLRINKAVLPAMQDTHKMGIAREQSLQNQSALAQEYEKRWPDGIPDEARGHYSLLRSGAPLSPGSITAAEDALGGKKNLTTLKPGESAYNSTTGEKSFGNTPPAPEGMGASPQPGYQPPRFTQKSDGTWTIESQPLPAPLYAFHDYLTKSGVPFGGADYNQKMADYAKLVPLQEGGNLASAARAVTGGQNPIVASGPQRPLDATNLKDMLAADQTVSQIQGLRAQLKRPEIASAFGSYGTNPTGAWARTQSEGTTLPGGIAINRKTLTDEQATAIAGVDFVRVQVQRAMEGLRPNSMYIKMLSSALPTANDPNIDAKLGLLERIFQDKRFQAEAAEGTLNRKAPPAPGRANPSSLSTPGPTSTSAPAGSAAGAGVSGGGAVQWVRDASGKLVPKR